MRLPLLEDLPDVKGKRVLVRADFNCPTATRPDGEVVLTDDYRIRATLPTLTWLQEQGAEITVCTHFGRPKGAPDPKYSLDAVRARLAELAPGVELQENLRFFPGETANDPELVDRLVAGQDFYVNDAFGVSHRAHASVMGPPSRLPSAAGRLLAAEVEALSRLLEDPEAPFVAVVGGAKVVDKLGVLRALAAKADVLIIGGGMSYTFLAALGHEIGESLLDADRIEDCRALIDSGVELLLPIDIVALAPGGAIHRNEPVPPVETIEVVGRDIPAGWEGLDMGPKTRARYAAAIASARTVLWNGPMGAFEDERFTTGTRKVGEAVAACEGFTVVGGGDSVSAITSFGLFDRISHVSSGGGASLEFIEQGDLPGIKALRDAANFS